MEEDSVVYEETDPGFFVGLSMTTSREYILVGAGDHVTSEVRLIPASDPGSTPLLVSPRRTGHEYSVDHQGDRFVIRTNDTHKNSRLVTAPAHDPTEKSWAPLVDASDSTTSAPSSRSGILSPWRSVSRAWTRCASSTMPGIRPTCGSRSRHIPQASTQTPNSTLTRCGSSMRRWSPHPPCSIITSPRASSKYARYSKSPAATRPRST